MVRILVADSPEGVGRELSVEIAEFPEGAEIVRHNWTGDPIALLEAAREVDAILTDYVPIDATVIYGLERCRVISVAATGYDKVAIEAAEQTGIAVCCVGEYCTGEVADHTLALILALNRRLFEYHRQVQERYSWAWDEVQGIRRLSGQTLGIIGLGRIGRAVARRAAGFGLSVIAHDPYVDASKEIRLVSLAELLESADIVSLHCNLDSDNKAVLNRAAFASMRRRPLLINVARGGLVDERALAEALDSGQIAGAGLDVLVDEPPGLHNHPLVGRDNVVLTPHVAFFSDHSLRQNRTISARNIRHVLEGRPELVFRLVTG